MLGIWRACPLFWKWTKKYKHLCLRNWVRSGLWNVCLCRGFSILQVLFSRHVIDVSKVLNTRYPLYYKRIYLKFCYCCILPTSTGLVLVNPSLHHVTAGEVAALEFTKQFQCPCRYIMQSKSSTCRVMYTDNLELLYYVLTRCCPFVQTVPILCINYLSHRKEGKERGTGLEENNRSGTPCLWRNKTLEGKLYSLFSNEWDVNRHLLPPKLKITKVRTLNIFTCLSFWEPIPFKKHFSINLKIELRDCLIINPKLTWITQS